MAQPDRPMVASDACHLTLGVDDCHSDHVVAEASNLADTSPFTPVNKDF